MNSLLGIREVRLRGLPQPGRVICTGAEERQSAQAWCCGFDPVVATFQPRRLNDEIGTENVMSAFADSSCRTPSHLQKGSV